MKRTLSLLLAAVFIAAFALPSFCAPITAREAQRRAETVIAASFEFDALGMVCSYTAPEPSDPILTSGITGIYNNIKKVTCCRTKEEAMKHPSHLFGEKYCRESTAYFIEYAGNLYVDVTPTEILYTEVSVTDFSEKAIIAEYCIYLLGGETVPDCKAVLENINGEYLLTFFRDGKDPGELTFDTSRVYTDVTHDAWFRDAVDYAFVHDLMNGVGGGKFAPGSAMSRAMLITVLWRTEGEPKSNAAIPFTDISADWYKEAVRWAYENGIISGVSDVSFAPDSPLTREQITAILFRYAKMKRLDVSKRTDFSTFPDAKKVHDYASDAMSWAVAIGLISGVKKGNKAYLDPSGNATRAQVSTILMRYLVSFGS